MLRRPTFGSGKYGLLDIDGCVGTGDVDAEIEDTSNVRAPLGSAFGVIRLESERVLFPIKARLPARSIAWSEGRVPADVLVRPPRRR